MRILLPLLLGSAYRRRIHDHSSTCLFSGDSDVELEGRALREEEVMARAPQTPLTQLEDASPSRLVSEMRECGVVRVDEVIPPDSVAAIREFVLEELRLANRDVLNDLDSVAQRFSSSLSPENRWDLKLPMTPQVESVLRTALRPKHLLGDTLRMLVGDNGELFELASFVTVNGAGRQVVHADTLWSRRPCLYTCTVALQEVLADMGPTVFIRGSNSKSAHKLFDSTPETYLLSSPHSRSTLAPGSAALYDSRTLHCGGANRASTPRVLFYFSFTNPEGYSEEDDSWNVASIREELRGKYHLRDFQ